MADRSKTTQHISLRVPLKELSVIDTYAAAHDTSRAQAVLHFVRSGIAAETGDGPATKADLVALGATLTKAIQDQPIAVQQAAPTKALPDPDTVGRAREDGRREGAEAGEAAGREEERQRIAGMGWRQRRRYLRR